MLPKISEKILTDMAEHAIREYPRECVGAIIGNEESGGNDSGGNDSVIRFSNIQDSLHENDPDHFNRNAMTAYFVDPKEVLELNRRVEKEGFRIIGFYHSHPDHEAYFSQEDHSAAVMWGEPVYPGVAYIIISVFGGEVKNAKVFTWDGSAYSASGEIPL